MFDKGIVAKTELVVVIVDDKAFHHFVLLKEAIANGHLSFIYSAQTL